MKPLILAPLLLVLVGCSATYEKGFEIKKKSPVDLDELFYFLNSYNEMEEGGTFYLRRLKKIIMVQIEKDYEEMGKTVKDLSMSYLDKQDNFWDELYKTGVDI